MLRMHPFEIWISGKNLSNKQNEFSIENKKIFISICHSKTRENCWIPLREEKAKKFTRRV
jgi:hypothetical protein